MRMKILLWIALIFLVFAMFRFVSAAGVATQTWEENPAMVYPGQEGVVDLYLQNMVGDEDLIFSVEYEQNDGEITSLDKMEYEVPLGRSDVKVELKYVIPEDAQVGQKYTVRLLFRTRVVGVEGGIRTGVGMGRVIPFEVIPESKVLPSPVEPEAKADYTVWYLVGVLIVAGIVVYFVMRKKR